MLTRYIVFDVITNTRHRITNKEEAQNKIKALNAISPCKGKDSSMAAKLYTVDQWMDFKGI